MEFSHLRVTVRLILILFCRATKTDGWGERWRPLRSVALRVPCTAESAVAAAWSSCPPAIRPRMPAMRELAPSEPPRDSRLGRRSGALRTPREPTKRASAVRSPRSPTHSPPHGVGLACTSRQQKLRNNVGQVFFPHALRFDVPLGLNARPPGSPGTVTDGRRRRVAHMHRIESGWRSPRDAGDDRVVHRFGSPRTAGMPVAQVSRSSHPSAVALKLSDGEKHERELQQIFQVIRAQIHENRTLYGKKVCDAHSLFEQMDRDNSGTLTRDEFSQSLTRLGVGLTAAQKRMIIEFLDTNMDNCVDYEEFMLQIVVGDQLLEQEEAQRRQVSVSKLRDAAWRVRMSVRSRRAQKSPAMQRALHLGEISHHKKKIDQTLSRIAATNEHRREVASLKRQAAVLEHDGDYGGALATLGRAKALTPHDLSIEIAEKRLRAKMDEPLSPAADSAEEEGEGERDGAQ